MVGYRGRNDDPPPWHLVESSFFWYLVEREGIDARELDEAIDAIKWTIARDPTFYPPSDDERVRIAHIRARGSIPAGYVYYTVHYDEQTCVLQWFRLFP